jgi:5'(3')-deoxyribonucleotidase
MNKIIAIDCDGVLLNWEQSFDDWMAFQGFPKHASDHYDVSMNYHMNKGQCEVLVKIFNESAWMKFLKPIEGAVENVKKLADLGYKFHVITSQTLDKKANQLREENLKEVFGDVFEQIECLDTGADKDEALSKIPEGTIWIEDKPANAELGSRLGLVALLLDLPHNQVYNEDNTLVQRIKNWTEIYNVIKEKHHGNT